MNALETIGSDLVLHHPRLSGTITAPASKSAAHRLLIAAALYRSAETDLFLSGLSEDLTATIGGLRALGAEFEEIPGGIRVFPIKMLPSSIDFHAGESGSTLRFLLPILASLGIEAKITLGGRLPKRPISPFTSLFSAHGVSLSSLSEDTLLLRGRLSGDLFLVDGSLSSQFLSGMLLALPLLPHPTQLLPMGRTVSSPYLALTEEALSQFGVKFSQNGRGYEIAPLVRSASPLSIQVEGDWSSAAFFLAAGAIGASSVGVRGLSLHSAQGDRAVLPLLRAFGADGSANSDLVTVKPGKLRGIRFDASDCPDLVPILSTVAAFAEGETVISGVGRLREKESDRLTSTAEMLHSLGARVDVGEDILTVKGEGRLIGGRVSSYHDHRIAMSAAIAATATEGSVRVHGLGTDIQKSYPGFLRDYRSLLSETAAAD